ncbi:MAG: hypothetical protein LUE99_13940 [Bacteroides sp.]|nr:hypothetical protein [Bacteroides sp.]
MGRSVTGSAATANLTVEDPSGLFTIPTSVDFAADAETATIAIGYNPADIAYDDYAKITLSLEGTGETTPYGSSVYTFEAGIPAPWKSIGKASFSDSYIFGNTYQVELQQNEDNPSQYRLVDPYSAALKAEEIESKGNQSPYLTFKLLAPGDKVGDVTIAGEGLVYFNPCCTGLYNTANDYNKDINIYHPSAFTKFDSESTWQHSYMTHYKEDETPGVVQLAPYYYMEGLGGWDNTQKDNMITIVFPGYVVADYSAKVVYSGRYTDSDHTDYAIAHVTLGEDVASAKVAMVNGTDVDAAIEGVINGTIESQKITASGNVSFKCTATDIYSFVVVTYAGGEPQETNAATFRFTPGETWKALGMATYTEDFITAFYNADPETYQVAIEESEQNPGKFRLKNAYGAAYPNNDEGDWDDSRDYYIEINAMDPDGVYIDFQRTGLDWDNGEFYVYSYAAYYLDNGYPLSTPKSKGLCGTYANGVITFPADALMAAFGADGDLSLANGNGAFKIVMPGVNPAIAKSFAAKSSATTRSLSRKATTASPRKLVKAFGALDNAVLVK